MILVTLGTIPFTFERAIQWLSMLMEEGVIQEDVVLQHGSTQVTVLEKYGSIRTQKIVDSDEFHRLIAQSRLVISHAGQGSTRLLAAKQASFVLLPRQQKFDEHIDDHQFWFAKAVEQKGVRCCWSIDELRDAILEPPHPLTAPLFKGPKLGRHLLSQYYPKAA